MPLRILGENDKERWSSSLYINNYRKFIEILEKVLFFLEPIDDDEDQHDRKNFYRVDEEDVNSIMDMLSAIIVASPKSLLSEPERCDDIYSDCPLVTFMLGLATCVLYKRVMHGTRPDCYSEFVQTQIPFCAGNNLFSGSQQPIKALNLEELTNSLSILELAAHTLKFDEALYQYVDALEERVCELLLHANHEDILNKKESRVAFKKDLYYCTTDTEFKLTVMIISVRRVANASLCLLRKGAFVYDESKDENFETLNSAAEYLERAVINKCLNIHSDIVQEEFENTFKENSKTASEVYMFHKINGVDARVDCAMLIQTFRDIARWSAITDDANRDITEYALDLKDRRSMAFQITFCLVVNLILRQTTSLNFTNFWIEGHAIYSMPEDIYAEFCKASKTTPFFVRSLGDACIYFSGRLYIFGQSSQDYYRALAFWCMTVVTDCGGVIVNDTRIQEFIEYICDETINPPVNPEKLQEDALRQAELEAKRSSDSYSTVTNLLSQSERVRQRAFDLFRRVRTSLQAEQQGLDSVYVIGDIESTGMPSSSKAGWD